MVGAVLSTLPFRNIDPGEGAARSADPLIALPVAMALGVAALPLVDCAYPGGSYTTRRRRVSLAAVGLGNLALLGYGVVLVAAGLGMENRLLGAVLVMLAGVATSRIWTMRRAVLASDL